MCSSSSFAKTTSGARRSTRAPKSSVPLSRIALQEARSTLIRARASPSPLDGVQRRAPHRLDHERIARDVQVVAAAATAGSISSGRSSRAAPRSAAIERPPSGDERADRPVATLDRADELDPERRQPSPSELPDVVVAGLPDEASRRAEHRRPCGHVRRLTARADADVGVRVATRCHGSGEPDDDVEREISERADEHCSGS